MQSRIIQKPKKVCISLPRSCQLGDLNLQDAPAGKGEALSELLKQYEAVASWSARSGTALALQSCALCFDSDDVSQAMNFLMGRGVVDADEEVRSRMLDAGRMTEHLILLDYFHPKSSDFQIL